MGWGGVAALAKELQAMQVNLIGEAIAVKYVPTTSDLSKCYDLGCAVAQVIK